MKKKNIGGQGKLGKPIKIGTLSVGLNLSQPQEEWEKDFDKLCEKKVYVPYVVGSNCGEEVCDIHLDDIKLFIKNLLSEQKERIIKEIDNIINSSSRPISDIKQHLRFSRTN